jgi:NAD(P)-dependent dehydrogenase (short-subunit alcohol dehydrogenase family)
MSTEPKVAVITGASQGIGEGLVRGFLDRGERAGEGRPLPGPLRPIPELAGRLRRGV